MKKFLVGSVITASVLLGHQSSNENTIPLSAIAGSHGIVFPDGKSRVVLKHVYVKKDKAYDGDTEITDSKKRSMSMKKTQLVYRQGLGSDFDIRAIVPYVQKDTNMVHPMNGTSYDNDSQGLGDIKLIGRYQVLNQKKGDPLFFAMGLGIKLPTGETDDTFTIPTGTTKSPTWQSGTGSTDYIAEMGITKILPNSRIDAHMMYQKNQKGDNDYQFGDTFKWNLGYSYALTKQFGLGLTLHGKYAQKNKSNDVSVDSTGGRFTYIAPSVYYKINKNFDISGSYSYMVQRDNNYDAATNTGGLSEQNQVMFRLGYNF